MSRCKCSKSDVRMAEHCFPYLEDITTKMEERRCDLIGKQQYLREKITTMERSIPALMAYNMWMAGQNCQDAPYCKVREMMKKLSPYPDPAERLLMNLKKTVKELNSETTDLHGKIIDTDVMLEEVEMALESMELANKELGETVDDLEKEVRSYTTPSLHSIHAQDLVCLTKIRQLAVQELNLKDCIGELEKKEIMFSEHLDHLMSNKDENICPKKKGGRQNNDKKGNCGNSSCKPACPARSKGKYGPKEGKTDAVVSTMCDEDSKNGQGRTCPVMEKKSSWIQNWWNGKPKPAEPSTESKTTETQENNTETKEEEPEKPTKDKQSNTPKNEFTTSSCKPCGHSPCPPPNASRKPRKCGASPNRRHPTANKFSSKRSCRTCGGETRQRVSHDFGGTCEICPAPSYGNCKCICRGKCARGLTEDPCNCSDDPLGYQPKPPKSRSMEDSSSDEDGCDCCPCGCEDSDTSSSCDCF